MSEAKKKEDLELDVLIVAKKLRSIAGDSGLGNGDVSRKLTRLCSELRKAVAISKGMQKREDGT
jgi:hypothetical protein